MHIILNVIVYKIGNTDLKAFEDFLENKKYFFGEKFCVIDAIIFSVVTQFVYYDRGQFNDYLIGKSFKI